MAINTINIGAVANDGTGDPIRSAFDTVNDNFAFVQAGLFAGTEPTIINAASVTTDYLLSNTYIYATTYANAGVLVSRGNIVSASNLFVQSNGAHIIGNVRIIGNLDVTGTQVASQSATINDSIINLHYSATPLVSDDARDIGLQWQYYKGSQALGFLGWQNLTSSLVYLDDVTQNSSNVITAGTPGNVKFGQLLLANTTTSTSIVTGALIVAGGAGIGGYVYVQSNVFVGNSVSVGNLTVRGYHSGSLYFAGADTIYIDGSPVITSATTFSGGPVTNSTQFNDLTAATSTTTGAVTIAGGLGVAGNIIAGNIIVSSPGRVTANIVGNVLTTAQPFITSLGVLTGLSVTGQFNSQNIVPDTNLAYSIGLGSSTRYNKIWTFDMDLSGSLTGGAINGTTATYSSSAPSTSSSTGALIVTGGVGVGGNLHINQQIVSAGNITSASNITATGNISASRILAGNITTSGLTATSNINTTANLVASTNIIASGNIIGSFSASTGFLGNLLGSPVTGNIHVSSHVIPTANITYDLGSSNRRFRDLWLSGTTIYIGGATISTDGIDVSIANPRGGSFKIRGGQSDSAEVTFGNINTSSGSFTGVVTAPTAPAGTANTQIATTEFVINNSVPTGALMMWSTGTAPTGWLLCDGSAVSRTTYAGLFAVVATTFGVGNGSTTFNLPNYTNRVPVGAGGLYSTAATGGSKDAILVSHTHTATVNDPGHSHTTTLNVRRGANALYTNAGWGGGDRTDATNVVGTSNINTERNISVDISTQGSSGTNANMPPYLAIYYIIKA